MGLGDRLLAYELVSLFVLPLCSLNKDPRKLGVMVHTCNLATWEHEQ